MTKKEYLDFIVGTFKWHILANSEAFKNYSYNNDKANIYLLDFFNRIKEYGLSFSKPYHLHGIGNNNEYRIFLKEKDNDGFIIEKNIAKFHCTYGIYGGISAWVEDYDTNEQLCCGINYAR